ncbi:ABC transporter A family member 7-like isoform X4 [Carex littledalei]|uniref:ABC transporter A family member 7-like isoform X4 n=1 Tax=Carex littledalei TaxID=544730 RepID=A0A833V0W0_9POAL|nr:ABC transporter A family member 7-like isoform X4 [Carex littledalei]
MRLLRSPYGGGDVARERGVASFSTQANALLRKNLTFQASNAFLKFLKGAGVTMEFKFVKETPKVGTKFRLDFSSLLGPLFFTWVVQLLFPVILTYLVYEKQQKLKIMMKIHGLTDGPYWLISYLYFLLLSAAYIIFFVIFGSLIGLNFFRLNDYSIQVVFYFIYINLQIAFAFLVASFFSTVNTAAVIGYIYVFGSGLLGTFLLQFFVEDPSFPSKIISQRELVENLVMEKNISNYPVISDNLRKVYPGRDGNPDKLAVEGLSLALPQGECFGMLGPNGAGKTSFIHMMTGLIKPTSGTAYVQGMDIRTDMDGIHTNMGVCPQHDLLWETLTGREHLLFYGRLKNLKGDALTKAVEESLKSVNLFYGGVGDKQVRTYSGGMKRRLSVAISLIGDPKVVYMDEPSTGLDPDSRNNLWNVVKRAKKDRAIILTTHSMEEAEVLCDRLGIFVDGSFQCLGNPKEEAHLYTNSLGFFLF